MTRAKMMEIALAAAKTSGRPYVTVTADQNVVANRRMTMFAEQTRCLYNDAVTFDLSPSGTIPSNGLYHLRDATNTFSKKLCGVDSVTVNGYPLRNLAIPSEVGLVGLQELRQAYPGYLGTATAAPRHACLISPEMLRLFPVPDQSYSNNFISGPILPADIDTTSGGDATALEFNEEDCEVVALFVAVGLVIWNAASDSDYQRMAFFSKPAAAHMEKLALESQNQMQGPSIRGGLGRTRVVTLG